MSGFPSLGGAYFHLAHVLRGGAGLTAALLLSLLAKEPKKQLIALLGGVGCGFFIDEIGKFVTRANDYFSRDAFFLVHLSLNPCPLSWWTQWAEATPPHGDSQLSGEESAD